MEISYSLVAEEDHCRQLVHASYKLNGPVDTQMSECVQGCFACQHNEHLQKTQQEACTFSNPRISLGLGHYRLYHKCATRLLSALIIMTNVFSRPLLLSFQFREAFRVHGS